MSDCRKGEQCDGRGIHVYRTKLDGSGYRGIVPCSCIPSHHAPLVGDYIERRQRRIGAFMALAMSKRNN